MQSGFSFTEKEKENLDFQDETLQVLNNWCFRLTEYGCDLVQFNTVNKTAALILARMGEYAIELYVERQEDYSMKIVASKLLGNERWSYECRASQLLVHFSALASKANLPL